MNGTFIFDDTGIQISPTLRLHLALVFLAHIYTLHDDSSFIGQDFDHLAALPFVLEMTTDQFNDIAFSYLNLHGTRSCYRLS
jgi:hypothetical protein